MVCLCYLGAFSASAQQAHYYFLIDTTGFTINGGPYGETRILRRVINLENCQIDYFNNEVGPPGAEINFSSADITVTGGTPTTLFISRGPLDNYPDNILTYSQIILVGAPNSIGFSCLPETFPMGIANDYQRRAYLVGDGLSAVDGVTRVSTYLADLPPAYRPAGQMTFREGSFYYPTEGHQWAELRVGANNDHYIRTFGSLPDTLTYAGLFTVPHTCDSSTTYLFHRDARHGATVYTVDLANGGGLAEHCRLPYFPLSTVYRDENVLPPCDRTFDLDTRTAATVHRYDTLCTGTVGLLDGFTALQPDLQFDSITIELLDPRDVAQEWLTVPGALPDVSVSGSGTTRITLASTGFTRGAAMMMLLQGLQYTQAATMPTQGQRQVRVTVHHLYYGTLAANIFIEVTTSQLAASATVSDPSCYGVPDGSIALAPSGGQQPYAVVWADGVAAAQRTALAPGTYAYLLTDGGGCQLADTFTLAQPDTLVLAIAAAQDTICNDTGVLTATATGGTQPYTYAWAGGAATPVRTTLGAGAYALTVTDANACTATAAYTLVAADVLTGIYTATACQGQPLTVAGQAYSRDTSFVLPYPTPAGCDSLVSVQLAFRDTSYTLRTAEFCPGDFADVLAAPILRDTFFQQVLATQHGCDSTIAYRLLVLPAPTTQRAAAICPGGSYAFGGAALTAAGTYTDTLAAANGCDSVAVLVLSVHPQPMPVVAASGSLCADGQATLSAGAYTSYSWSTGSTAPTLPVAAPGDYGLTVTDANGCTGSGSLRLDDAPPQVAFSTVHPLCPDGTGGIRIDTIIGGMGPFRVLETGGAVASGQSVGGFAAGAHQVTVVGADGCRTGLAFTLAATTTIDATLPAELVVEAGESVVLPLATTFNATTVRWQPAAELDCPDCLQPTATPTATTRYRVELADDGGCQWLGELLVRVLIKGIYIPNAFSPNGDARNDVFQPYTATPYQTVLSVDIFDRWGAHLHRSDAPPMGWDGTVRGADAAPGIYAYVVTWRDALGETRVEKGEVVLVR